MEFHGGSRPGGGKWTGRTAQPAARPVSFEIFFANAQAARTLASAPPGATNPAAGPQNPS